MQMKVNVQKAKMLMTEHIEISTVESERKIIEMLTGTNKPIFVQALADQINKSYDSTKRYLDQIGKRLNIIYSQTDDGLAVQLLPNKKEARFR
jgi:transcription antitermination factor NusA-like protein